MARHPYEIAVENRRVARRRVKNLERRSEKAHGEADEADRQLERARKLLDGAENHPDLDSPPEGMTPDSHVAGHGADPGADVVVESGSSEYADGHDPATYSDADAATHRAVAEAEGAASESDAAAEAEQASKPS